MPSPSVYFFTDFGIQGPYLGQMESVLLEIEPTLRVINLMCDAPFANPKAGAYLLAALFRFLPDNAIVVAVVDPGVGSDRKALCLNIGNRWCVGPDNGLLAVLANEAEQASLWELVIPFPDKVSVSFHGRDVFAPAAGALACGELPKGERMSRGRMLGSSWGRDLREIIYIDGFGNAMTGIEAGGSSREYSGVRVKGHFIRQAETFSAVPEGALFCYRNSIGLIEIAVNRGSAREILGLSIGEPVEVVKE